MYKSGLFKEKDSTFLSGTKKSKTNGSGNEYG
jgi:hypothetical protein